MGARKEEREGRIWLGFFRQEGATGTTGRTGSEEGTAGDG